MELEFVRVLALVLCKSGIAAGGVQTGASSIFSQIHAKTMKHPIAFYGAQFLMVFHLTISPVYIQVDCYHNNNNNNSTTTTTAANNNGKA